jgi:hypothetical protein
MVGKIFITRTGYDPQLGKHVKDPYLGATPTLGACRPDIRRLLSIGDHIFVISGRVPDAAQFVMGGFEIAAKINAIEAYQRFPKLRLSRLPDGQLTGNIIVNGSGNRHEFDDHRTFESRIENYVVGANVIALETAEEISQGRQATLEVLNDVLEKKGKSPVQVVGRWGTQLTERQVLKLRDWLDQIKRNTN